MKKAAVVVSENIRELVGKIIIKNNLKNVVEIKYHPGSQSGDGYVSKTLSVEIVTNDDIFRIFIKYALDVKSTESVPIDKLYACETYFYDTVYPAYQRFLAEKQLENVFHHVPKCYGTSEKDGIVALENLKHKGFTMYDRRKVMDRPHLEIVLRTFAKFHAVSFAFKDQQRKRYQELIDNSYGDFFSKVMEVDGSVQMVTTTINNFLEKLDAVKDKWILDKCENLVEKLLRVMSSPKSCVKEYSILTQGDCWCNNIMFTYSDDSHKNPTDIVLIDWQMLREATPVFDISYFFYTIASQEGLDNLDHYLEIYYQELRERIKDLGSDPDELYPLHVFRKECKEHLKYGFAMAFMLVRMMLSAEDEVVSMEGLDFANAEDLQKMYPKLKREDEFIWRMKALAEHMIKNNLL
ncbi:hypothetical protein Trydic_g19657 [Trypoxylus dichotomus]